MAEELGERTEKPTARRRREARNKGQVAKSQDLAGAILLLGAVILLVVFVSVLGEGLARVLRRSLTGEALASPVGPDLAPQAVRQAFDEIMWMVAPMMLIIFVLAGLSHFIQIGPLLTAEPLKPKLDKLSPIKGIKRIFGLRGIMKTVMNSAKLAAMIIVSYIVIAGELDKIAALPQLEAGAAFVLLGRIILTLALWLAFCSS